MFKQILSTLAIASLHATSANALTVDPGEVIRGAYAFPTVAGADLAPSSFLLRLSSADRFGGADSVGVRYLNATLSPLSFSQFDANGSGLDATIGIPFDASDFSSGVVGVPATGFVDIIGLAGSFDVAAIDLFAIEPVGSGIFRQNRVTEFERVVQPPSAVPLPAAGWFMLACLGALFCAGRKRPA